MEQEGGDGYDMVLVAHDNCDPNNMNSSPPDVDYLPIVNDNGPTLAVNAMENELQHASYMSTDSTGSTIRVEIADIGGEDSIYLTTMALRKCKSQVLRLYWRLLVFIGWRGFGRESVNSGSLRYQILNVVYPVCIVLLLFYTYIYEIVACQWKLNVITDIEVITTTTPRSPQTTLNVTMTTDSFPLFSFGPAIAVVHNVTPAPVEASACEHIITTYGIPNALHFIAFVLGFIHFRVRENEQLYALMEKVFLQATPLNSQGASQQKVIARLRLFLAGGAFWVVATLILQGIYVWAFDFPAYGFVHNIGAPAHWILFTIELLGIMVLNSVNLAVISNYITQCEMIIFYVKGVTLRLEEKSIDLMAAMKDILMVRKNIAQLNGPMANMTSLVGIIFAELTIIGLTILVLNKNNSYKVWVYRSIFPCIWLVMLLFPLFQAARVNSICKRFIKIALEMRVFGYKGICQLDLDSFLLFLNNTKLRAKLFHIPIQPSYVIATLVLAAFIVLILFQTSILGPSNHLF